MKSEEVNMNSADTSDITVSVLKADSIISILFQTPSETK